MLDFQEPAHPIDLAVPANSAKTSAVSRLFHTFRRARPVNGFVTSESSSEHYHGGLVFNERRAAAGTANTALVRRLKGRHLQMIAIGGSIGTGLWIGTGKSLAIGGPGSAVFAYMSVGAVLYCTMQAMGELAALFPVAGSFAAFGTRFIDPAWGFAMGWNYALQWLVVVPLEMIAALRTLMFWRDSLHIPQAAAITVFLVSVFGINMCGVRAFGEAEFVASMIKAAAVMGFIILGIIINLAGNQSLSYIGTAYWTAPHTPFRNSIHGFSSVLVFASFAYTGTELVGLAAAETQSPTRAIPLAVKQVFWRITCFYVLSVFIVGLIVPADDSRLTGAEGDPSTSPFVIAIQDAGIAGLDSVMNAVILISVLSVANSSFFGSSRVLAALAEQHQAPRVLRYVDHKGRPIVAVGIAGCVGMLAYAGTSSVGDTLLDWLIALSGLSSILTWGSICLAHIRFRKAWKLRGHQLHELVYQSTVGVAGSWAGLGGVVLILAAQLWVALDPVPTAGNEALTPQERVAGFFQTYMAIPVVLAFYLVFKVAYKTRWVPVDEIDVDTGRYRVYWQSEDKSQWPLWKKMWHILF